MSKWREQYDRVHRWHVRFGELNTGRQHNVASDNYIDEIHAFFQNCYHLKDWLRNDASLPQAIRDDVVPYIASSRPLRLCADICNSLKHLTLTRKPRSNENPQLGARRFHLELGAETPTISLQYEVNTDSGSEDAYELACACVDAWEEFIRKSKL